MVERQDIDALLISALYGELTPAEEERLAAHLESHPADKAVLSDLTEARSAVRESRILQTQVEPPQSISAMLMQEAARRAPKQASEEPGWFQRFLRSFMAHPAFAAAAMLVVVIGVATIVSRRKGDQFVESTAPSAVHTQALDTDRPGTPAAPADKQQGAAPALGSAAAVPPAASEAAPQAEAQATAGSAFRVGLDDAVPSGAAHATKAKAGKGADDGYVGAPALAQKTATSANKKDSNYVELRKREPAPKDLDTAKLENAEGAASAGDTVRADRGAGGGGATAGGAAAPSDASRRYAQPVSPPPPAVTSGPGANANAITGSMRDERVTNAPAPAKAARAPAAAPTTTAAPVEDKATSNDPQFAWASTQHRQVVSAVRAGNCRDASKLAVEISNRAPSYYQQYVVTDRELKECLAYINHENEKDAAQRAQKNRPTATKRALDETKPADKPAATH